MLEKDVRKMIIETDSLIYRLFLEFHTNQVSKSSRKYSIRLEPMKSFQIASFLTDLFCSVTTHDLIFGG